MGGVTVVECALYPVSTEELRVLICRIIHVATRCGDAQPGGSMHIARPFFLLLGAAAPVWAQSSSPSVDLRLPAEAVRAQSSPAPESKANPDPAASTAATPSAPTLPAPYDETYGTRRDAAQKGCDDKTYGQPQIHGSIGMGVAAGNRVSGNYQTGTIAVTKALGSCDDPKGTVRASISVGQSNVNFRRGGRP